MSAPKAGGQAFPHYPAAQYEPGMTLRDYFAAKVAGSVLVDAESYGQAAELAYELADAMLKAREQPA